MVQVPSSTILCNLGLAYIFYRYYPAIDGKPARLVKSPAFEICVTPSTSLDSIKAQLKPLVCAIARALDFEKREIQKAITGKRMKPLPGTES